MYEKLGARAATLEGVAGVSFALWAPNARRVSVVGDFNYWDGRRHPLRLRRECGVWEIFIPDLAPGARYKLSNCRPPTAACCRSRRTRSRSAELRRRRHRSCTCRRRRRPGTVAPAPRSARKPAACPPCPTAAADRPIAVYEMHAGSWRRGESGRWLSWGEIGDRLLPYIQQLGFTHVELLR